ncbi:MAG: GDSL-type esterase/lipase family protein [Opitutaceae bacterium]
MNPLVSRSTLLLVLASLVLPAAALRANTATEPVPRDAQWMKRHDRFVARAHRGDVNVLFLGDSITDMWRDATSGGAARGKAVWERDFAPLGAANFGIGGDRTQHLLWRLEHGELDGISPKVVVLLIGTNNLSISHETHRPRNTVKETAAGVKAVVHEILRRLPSSKILLLGLFPRRDRWAPAPEAIAALNRRIAKLADGRRIVYLDIGSKFLEPDGTLSRTIMPDLLHPDARGYEIWANAIRGPLAKLLRSS